MPTTPRGGYPYPSPSDRPDVPKDIRALAEAVDAAEWEHRIFTTRATYMTDAAGYVKISHGLTYPPGQEPVLQAHANLLPPASGNASAVNVLVQSLTATQVWLRVFRIDGTPLVSNNITVWVTVFPNWHAS